jgi:hypothetical protein
VAKSDDDLIAEFLAHRGPTRCPTAIAVTTLGVEVSQEDAAAHRRHDAEADERYRTRMQGRGRWKRK